MIAAADVGLFDAALTCLWDERVNDLRRRGGFDLRYFYDIAAGSSDVANSSAPRTHLTCLGGASLLAPAREIGLLADRGRPVDTSATCAIR